MQRLKQQLAQLEAQEGEAREKVTLTQKVVLQQDPQQARGSLIPSHKVTWGQATSTALADKWGLRLRAPVLGASVQFSTVAQSCPTLCDPMNRSTPGLPVHHQLLEFTQTHVHRVGDAIQPPHPLSSPSPPAFNLSQHQGLLQ